MFDGSLEILLERGREDKTKKNTRSSEMSVSSRKIGK